MGGLRHLRIAVKAPRTLAVECERCGQPMTVERAGRYRDEDFLELFHDYMELEATLREYVELRRAGLLTVHDQMKTIDALTNQLAAAQNDLFYIKQMLRFTADDIA